MLLLSLRPPPPSAAFRRASAPPNKQPSSASSLDALDSLLSVDGDDAANSANATPATRVPIAKQDAAPRTSFLNPGRQTGRFINEAVLRSDVAAGRATRLGEPVDLPRAWPSIVAATAAAGQVLSFGVLAAASNDSTDALITTTTTDLLLSSPLDLLFAAHASTNDALACALLLLLLGTESEAVYGSGRALAIYAASTGAGLAAALLAIAASSGASTTATTTTLSTCCIASAGAVGLAAAAAASAAANGQLPWLPLLTDRLVSSVAQSEEAASKVRWLVFAGVVAAAAGLEVAGLERITTSPAGVVATFAASALAGYSLGSLLCPRWQLQRDVQLEDGAMSLPAEATLLLSSKANGGPAATPATPTPTTTKRTPLQIVVVAVDRRGSLERSLALVGATLAVSIALKIATAAAGV